MNDLSWDYLGYIVIIVLLTSVILTYSTHQVVFRISRTKFELSPSRARKRRDNIVKRPSTPSDRNIEPRYSNNQQFSMSLLPQNTFDSCSCNFSSLSRRSDRCDSFFFHLWSFRRKLMCIRRPRSLSVFSLFHPHIQQRIPTSPSGSG